LTARLLGARIGHPRPFTASAAAMTIVVPAPDRPGELNRCLGAAGPLPKIVVDDGSTDPPAIAAVCARHDAHLVRREVPGGSASARNEALDLAQTGLDAFLDSDCIPQDGWLEPLCGALADPAGGVAHRRIRPLGAAGDGTVARFVTARSPLDPGPRRAGASRGRVADVPTAELLIRREALGAGAWAAQRRNIYSNQNIR
jgi:glycosyltransferase involved in cell wall biosynthesis